MYWRWVTLVAICWIDLRNKDSRQADELGESWNSPGEIRQVWVRVMGSGNTGRDGLEKEYGGKIMLWEKEKHLEVKCHILNECLTGMMATNRDRKSTRQMKLKNKSKFNIENFEFEFPGLVNSCFLDCCCYLFFPCFDNSLSFEGDPSLTHCLNRAIPSGGDQGWQTSFPK